METIRGKFIKKHGDKNSITQTQDEGAHNLVKSGCVRNKGVWLGTSRQYPGSSGIISNPTKAFEKVHRLVAPMEYVRGIFHLSLGTFHLRSPLRCR